MPIDFDPPGGRCPISYWANQPTRPRVSEAQSVADVTYISIAQRRWDEMHPPHGTGYTSDRTLRVANAEEAEIKALLQRLEDMGSRERIEAYLTEQRGWFAGYWDDPGHSSNMAKLLGYIRDQRERAEGFLSPGPDHCGQLPWQYIGLTIDPAKAEWAARYPSDLGVQGRDRKVEFIHLPVVVREFANYDTDFQRGRRRKRKEEKKRLKAEAKKEKRNARRREKYAREKRKREWVPPEERHCDKTQIHESFLRLDGSRVPGPMAGLNRTTHTTICVFCENGITGGDDGWCGLSDDERIARAAEQRAYRKRLDAPKVDRSGWWFAFDMDEFIRREAENRRTRKA